MQIYSQWYIFTECEICVDTTRGGDIQIHSWLKLVGNVTTCSQPLVAQHHFSYHLIHHQHQQGIGAVAVVVWVHG